MTKSSTPSVLVFDIGGTNLRAAQYHPGDNSLTSVKVLQSPNFLKKHQNKNQELFDQIIELMESLTGEIMDRDGPDLVSIAFPGPVDAEGNALAAPTLLGSSLGEKFPFARACERLWPMAEIIVVNDLTAAGYRYVAKGHREFCILTVGSGIGHKVFIDGKPQIGRSARGGELGHLRVDRSPSAPLCDCGRRGHLGGIASGRGVLALARRQALRDLKGFEASSLRATCDTASAIDNESIVRAFVEGDPWVGRVIQEAADFLGQGLAAIHLAVGVEEFFINGGFALALGEDYRRLLVDGLGANCWDLGQGRDIMIELSHPDDADGLIGAGVFAAEQGLPK